MSRCSVSVAIILMVVCGWLCRLGSAHSLEMRRRHRLQTPGKRGCSMSSSTAPWETERPTTRRRSRPA